MVYRDWLLKKTDAIKSKILHNELDLPCLVCDVLTARGYDDQEKVIQFLETDIEISSPSMLLDMDKACERILHAVDTTEKIAIFGDYDVDGVTATALLFTYLDGLGANVMYKLPNRIDDGYGLCEAIVADLAEQDVKLIITVDNGISAFEAVEYAKTRGIDVVVTDHHLPPAILPNAVAVVDMHRQGDNSPFKNLSGVGVAFKLVCALEDCEPEEMLDFYSDLAAIGTVADLMPLIGENRVIVREGILRLQNCERPGIVALIEECGLAGKEITAENVSFAIAPRLNAAGRMDTPDTALKLLLCDDVDDAQIIVQALVANNLARQKTEHDSTEEIIAKITQDESYNTDGIIVVSGEGYHQGVIGIIASRLVEYFSKPTIVISLDSDGIGHGSGRSIGDISLYDALCSAKDLLLGFGGHSMAAGLSINADKIEPFRQKINAYIKEKHPVPKQAPLEADALVELSKLDADDVLALASLAPFGCGNPSPIFLLKDAVIDAMFPLSEGKHTRFRFKKGNASIGAAIFNLVMSDSPYVVGDRVDVLLSLSVYESKQGEAMLSARIKDMRCAGMGNVHTKYSRMFNAYCAGVLLSAQQKSQLLPTRSEVAMVYRHISAKPLCSTDLRPVFAAFGEENTGKTLTALAALKELGLIHESGNFYKKTEVTQKKNLDDAKILHSLGA